MYPIVSNWYGEYTAHTWIESYDKTIQTVGNEALNKMQKDADSYNTALAKHDDKKIRFRFQPRFLTSTVDRDYLVALQAEQLEKMENEGSEESE